MSGIYNYARSLLPSAETVTAGREEVSRHLGRVWTPVYSHVVVPSQKFYQSNVASGVMESLRLDKKNLEVLRTALFAEMKDKARNIEVKTPDGETLDGVYFPHLGRKQIDPVMIVMWGVAGTYESAVCRERALEMQKVFRMDVMSVNYRGVGKSSGYPYSSKDLVTDAEAIIDWVKEHIRIPADQILIYGTSLGGVVGLQAIANKAEGTHILTDRSFLSLDAGVRAFGARVIGNNALVKSAVSTIAYMGDWALDSEEALKRLEASGQGSHVVIVHHAKDDKVPSDISLAKVYKDQKYIDVVELTGTPQKPGFETDYHTSWLTDPGYVDAADRCNEIFVRVFGEAKPLAA